MSVQTRKRVYLHEFNILMGRKVFLPNVSGMLRAFAETNDEIVSNYEFMPFLFIRDKPEVIARQWDKPDVLAFSSSIWNHQLNLAVAAMARKMFPEALIVFGGPHVPNDGAEAFLREHPFVDLVVINEGEPTFAEILTTFLKTRDFSSVESVAFIHPETKAYMRTANRQLEDINKYPSPYTGGLYDQILDSRGDTEYQVIIETNRGCPFKCGFCFWGSRNNKVRFFDIGRIKDEVGWIAGREIEYVFGADANFGMIPRDIEVARAIIEIKRRTGYPHAFRVCYGKNAEDRVFNVAELLDAAGLTKGVTVSFQSTDPQTLMNIGRGNISITVYRNLLKRYREKKIPIYTELILGMPGETYDSFAKGLNELFEAGLYDQIGIFFCIVLPNTPMADPNYGKTYGLQVRRIELVEPHASKRKEGEVMEYEDIIIATNTMPIEEWKRTATLAWIAQTLHGLKLGFFVALYLFNRFGISYVEFFEYLLKYGDDQSFPTFRNEISNYREYLEKVVAGSPQCVFMEEFGEISWQIEEATFLRLSKNLNEFYKELLSLTQDLVRSQGIVVGENELSEVVRYQRARIASLEPRPQEYQFSFRIPEYFELLLSDQNPTWTSDIAGSSTLKVETIQYETPEEFATKTIWFGRRDSRAVEAASWHRNE